MFYSPLFWNSNQADTIFFSPWLGLSEPDDTPKGQIVWAAKGPVLVPRPGISHTQAEKTLQARDWELSPDPKSVVYHYSCLLMFLIIKCLCRGKIILHITEVYNLIIFWFMMKINHAFIKFLTENCFIILQLSNNSLFIIIVTHYYFKTHK